MSLLNYAIHSQLFLIKSMFHSYFAYTDINFLLVPLTVQKKRRKVNKYNQNN